MPATSTIVEQKRATPPVHKKCKASLRQTEADPATFTHPKALSRVRFEPRRAEQVAERESTRSHPKRREN